MPHPGFGLSPTSLNINAEPKTMPNIYVIPGDGLYAC